MVVEGQGSGLASGAFDAFARALPGATVLLSLGDGLLLACNSRARTLIGAIALGTSVAMLGDSPEQITASLSQFSRSSSPTSARWQLTVDGERVDLHASGARVSGFAGPGSSAVLVTLTPKKDANSGVYAELPTKLDAIRHETHDLRHLNAVLEKTVAERTEGLEQKNRELDALNSSLNGFVFMVSHDLLGPTNRIHTFSKLLRKSLTEQSVGADSSRMLEYLRESTDRLRMLIEGIVRLSQLKVDETGWSSVALGPLLSVVVDDARGLNPYVDIDVQVDALDFVRGDAGQIHQLLLNLLNNAIKFRVPDQPSIITIRTLRVADSDQVTLCVRDDGMGIHAGEHERVLQPFVRGSGVGDVAGGGLGLAMCQRICQLHGGTLWIESSTHMNVGSPSGTEIRLTLPAGDV